MSPMLVKIQERARRTKSRTIVAPNLIQMTTRVTWVVGRFHHLLFSLQVKYLVVIFIKWTRLITNSSLLFIGEKDFTHATQDQDHGAPQSQRMTITDRGRGKGRQHHYGSYLSPVESESSFTPTSDTTPGYIHYMLPDATLERPPTWVYEWQDPDFYNQIFSQWQITSYCTRLSWQ